MRRGWRGSGLSTPDARLQALGEFICADRGRALAAANRLWRGGPRTVESAVRGMSMGEVIPDGARIRIAADTGAYTTGTVIAFFAGGRTVVHRIRWQRQWGRARGHLITQGDAMLLPDIPVPREAVLGAVVAVRAANGDWRPPASRPPAPRRERALSALVLAAGIVLLELHRPLACYVLDLLSRAERRWTWTRSLLY